MLNYIEYLNMPERIALILVCIFFAIQVIGELLELEGKIVPEFFKIRKYFIRKKKEKNEAKQVLEEVKQLLSSVDAHYSADNIAKRDSWMRHVNSRVDSIDEINKNLSNFIKALKDCTNLTEEMFVQNSRDRIIDFAEKASDKDSMVSREEFNRIFKVYNHYEDFLEERGRTNGEVDIAYKIIQESYAEHIKNRTFREDIYEYDV